MSTTVVGSVSRSPDRRLRLIHRCGVRSVVSSVIRKCRCRLLWLYRRVRRRRWVDGRRLVSGLRVRRCGIVLRVKRLGLLIRRRRRLRVLNGCGRCRRGVRRLLSSRSLIGWRRRTRLMSLRDGCLRVPGRF